jgi:hypothetical protein
MEKVPAAALEFVAATGPALHYLALRERKTNPLIFLE